MNWFKLILVAVVIIIAAMVAFSIIGIVYSALWYLFLLGIVAIGGAVGYKLLVKDKETPQLGDKMPITIAEMKNHDRALEEYKRKYLPK
jgi:4-hydroxybenzoate polyprenyltransferase